MHRIGLGLAALALAVLLSACNTTDALTPKVDVGGGLYPSASSPVSQDDARRIAAEPDTADNSGYYPNPPSRASRPQNSLEAQARAIEDGGRSPVASAPLEGLRPREEQRTDRQPAEQRAERRPAGQTETPSPIQSQQSQPPSSSQQSSSPPAGEVQAADPQATRADGGTIRFLPIIGAPVQAVTPLSRQLGASARAKGLTIKPSSDPSSEHILKGYLSAFDNEDKVTVVYVWDVLDGSGARLHRIQGQESVPASGGDPWAAVPATTMQSVGEKTIGEYMRWRQEQRP